MSNKKSLKSLEKNFSSTYFLMSLIGKKSALKEIYKLFPHLQFNENENFSIAEAYDQIYEYLLEHHRYEYLFKSEFFLAYYDEILSGSKKLLYEIRLYEDTKVHNILDLLLISDSYTHAIEIKSDTDWPYRLDTQLPFYCKLFKYVSVLVSDYKVDIYREYIDNLGYSNIGIISLSNDAIATVRAPESNENRFDETLLKQNINMYCKTFTTLFDRDFDVNKLNGVSYTYNYFIYQLNQIAQRFDRDFVGKLPNCLKFYGYIKPRMGKLRKYRLLKTFNRL